METKNNAAQGSTLETQGGANSGNKDKTFSEKFRIVDGQLQFFHERKGIWMPCDAVPDGDCRKYRTLPDGTLEEIVGIPQTPDINNVSEGDNSDEPLADMNPPEYDPFDWATEHEEPVNEALPPQQPEAMVKAREQRPSQTNSDVRDVTPNALRRKLYLKTRRRY
jgi:hypothetical protein